MAIEDRNLEPGTKVIAKYKKEEYTAEVIAGEDGKVKYRLADGREFKSPSSAGTAITNKACNGWAFWSAEAGGAPSEAEEPEGDASEETETGEQNAHRWVPASAKSKGRRGRRSETLLRRLPEEYAEDVAEARRLGGLRRRREVTVSGAYEVNGLETVGDLRRLLVIASLDTLGLENSIARARTLGYLVGVAGKLLEPGSWRNA